MMASDSDSGAQAGSSTQAVFYRLVSSLSLSVSGSASGRTTPTSPSAALQPLSLPDTTTVTATEEEPAMPASPLPLPPPPPPTESRDPSDLTPAIGEPLQRVASTSSSLKRARKKIAERLKQLGRDSLGKLRRGGGSGGSGGASKSVPASPRLTPGDVERSPPEAGAATAPLAGHAKLLSVVAELDEPEGTIRSPNAHANTNANASTDPPSAMTLAKRIQSLIDALPFPTPQAHDIPVPTNPGPPERDSEGRPVFPPNTTPVRDSRLIAFLSSPTIMNGSGSGGGGRGGSGRPSIWSVLEALGVPPHGLPPPASGEESAEGAVREGAEGGAQQSQSGGDTTPVTTPPPPPPPNTNPPNPHPVLSDDTSVLLYSPLIPGDQDLVELGEQVPITIDSDEFSSPYTHTPWTAVWPLSLWYDTPTPTPALAMGEGKRSGGAVRVQTVQAWVPSTTKLSVQALWWGYRLYLPPPILAIIGNEALEATQRAALITTALTWFFNNLPVTALPAALQPAALLLQRLAPYLGYIGTFISWSWGTIKSYDVGYGVILSATWLLPVALIPSTWKATDFPTSPSQNARSPPLPPHVHAPAPASPRTAPSLPPSPSTAHVSSPPPTSPVSLSSPLLRSSSTPTSPSPPPPSNKTPKKKTRKTAQIPIPPIPPSLEDTTPPVPPVASTPGVPPDSPLGEQLLHGPLLGPVPLPEEGEEGVVGTGEGEGVGEVKGEAKEKRRGSGVGGRARALFMRSPKLKP